jgi:hypothetical protein
LASSVAMNPATTSHQPLAIHGDWQAFFDEERYNLMYYFNTKTGDSQWEPPDDFPIPVLDSHAASPFTAMSAAAQSYYRFAEQKQNQHVTFAATAAVSSAAAAKKQMPVKRVTPQVTKDQPDVASVFFKAAFGFAATVAGKAAEAVADHVMKQHYDQHQQQSQQQKQPSQQKSVAKKAENNKPWWLSFFHQEKPNQEPEAPIRPSRLEASVPSSKSRNSNLDVMDLLSEVNEKLMPSHRTASSPAPGTIESSYLQQPAQASTNTANNKKQPAFWSSWNNNAADEPTKPLVPPLQREQWLQEKLYADSLKRQENLRKSYRKVIENRSPTISLSALKRDHKKDWHQYLEEV